MVEPSRDGAAVGRDEAVVRRWLCERLAAATGSTPAGIDVRLPFDSLGVTSTEAVSIAGELEEWLGCRLPQSLLYEHVSIEDLTAYLAGGGVAGTPTAGAVPADRHAPTTGPAEPADRDDDPPCITGMACRFPDADSVQELWQNLLDGRDSSAQVPADRWEAETRLDDDPDAPGATYTTRGSFVRDAAGFDAAFFDISPREAVRMDPRQRILLELCWQAMEDAGLPADGLRGSRTGVFVGMMADNQYATLQVDQGEACLDDPYFGIGTAASVVAGRLSYCFDLQGPSVLVDTACSSALVALHLAMRSVAAGECDRALVGAASLTAHPDSLRQACRMRMLAVDGRTKTFDAAADGFLLGEGAGVVVVERLSAAASRRQALAVLRGSATNQDGATNGLTAPSQQAQVDVIRRALADARLRPQDIDYVEAHGSGTALGDAIEVSGLQEVFAADRPVGRPLVIGAVKTNVGHLTGASGMAGLIKTVLALGHGRIPANLHLREPNPAVDWDSRTVRLPGDAMDWPGAARPRRAGISSFGWSGSNAHVVLEQAPLLPCGPAVGDGAAGDWQALLVSARTATGVGRVAAGLESALAAADAATGGSTRADGDARLADVAFTTQTGRSALEHRAAIVSRDAAGARAELAALSGAPRSRRAARHGHAEVAFLMPGIGDQYPALGRLLYEREPAFRSALDLCAGAAATAGVDVLRWLYPPEDGAPAAQPGGDLRALLGRTGAASASPLTGDVEVAHAAVFALDYACAALWQQMGVRPAAVLGYSLGEYAAATVAGVFDACDGARLVIERARLVAQAPRGVMLTVATPASRLVELLGAGLDLAADNGPLTSVAAGPEPDIAWLEAQLTRVGIAHRRVPTTHAMHSRLLSQVRDRLVDLVDATRRRPPAVPLVSNLTGEPLSPEQAVDPEYWGDHMCATVRLADGVQQLAAQGVAAVLDLGSGQLGSLATQVLSARAGGAATPITVSSLPPAYRHGSEREVLLRAAAQLWEVGASVDWSTVRPPGGRLTTLPGYPFEHRRFWPGRPEGAAISAARDRSAAPPSPPPAPAPSPLPDPPAGDTDVRLYTPCWELAPAPTGGPAPVGPVLLLTDDTQQGGRLAAALAPATCVLVRSGSGFAELPGGFEIRPTSTADHERLLGRLRDDNLLPRSVVHLWSASWHDDGTPADPAATIRDDHELGFGSLLALGQALAHHLVDGARLLVVTTGARAVLPGEPVRLGRGTLAGVALTLSQEHPDIAVRTLDLPVAEPTGQPGRADWVEHVLAELGWPGPGPVVAIRGGQRLVRGYRRDPHPAEAPRTAATTATRLRERGVYLITGGLGRVGLLTAAHLARRVRARLVLTGRQGLPPRERWAALLEGTTEGRAPDPTAQRIRAVQEIEALGAEVLVAALDVGDPDAVRDLLSRVEARFGPPNGLIHAAGSTERASFAPIATLGPQGADAHLVPKVFGTLALDAALAGRSLDFCLAMSSMSAVLGGIGFAGYASANTFLDLLAESGAGHRRWTTIDWDTWRTTVDGHAPGDLGSTLDRYSIAPAEGVRLLEDLLADTRPAVVVAAGGLERRLLQWATPADPFTAATTPATGGATGDPAAPVADRPDLAVPFLAPRSPSERRIARLWAEAIGIQQVGVNDNFFDLGGNSLIGMQLVNSLTKEFGRPIPTVALFEAPTVVALAEYLDAAPVDVTQPPPDPQTDAAPAALGRGRGRTDHTDDIAIIGMAGRFPGADDVHAFWRNLTGGVESITFFTEDELRAEGVPAEQLSRPGYVPARPVLRTIADFDAEFFGYTPWEAGLADPQQRLFLECVWECLEDAGYAPRSTTVPVGVFGGANISTYLHRLAAAPESVGAANEYQLMISNDKDSLTLNTSYRLDLRGPSVTVQTFCSTSLLAVHLACRSLVDGECGMAVAGGVSVRVPDRVGYVHTPGGMESPDGHVRTFDAQAGGVLFGDGCAVVALKRLRQALDDGDHVVAVIRGSAANNDGSLKVGFSAPSIRGQAEVVARAQAVAGIDPRTVTYVEAHGTATELGDPIEVAALTRAFGVPDAGQYCAIGSVKTNIGHLDRAAGTAGLIKTALALKHRLIPASLNYTSPNPEIDFERSPFKVNAELSRWEPPNGLPRRAGVNSLGMGGTNVHVVLEEAPECPARPPQPAQSEALLLSARTPQALAAARTDLAGHLAGFQGPLSDVAFTLQTGREHFEHRLALVARGAAEAAALLSAGPEAGTGLARVRSGQSRADGPQPVFGLAEPDGDPAAARALYRSDPELRQQVDAAGVGRPDLLAVLAGDGQVTAAAGLRAGLLVQYALATGLERCGVRPAAILAQGAAACTAAALAGTAPFAAALAALDRPGAAPAATSAEQRVPCLFLRRGEAVPVSLADPAVWTGLLTEPPAPVAGRITLPEALGDGTPLLLSFGPAPSGRLVGEGWPGRLIEPGLPTGAASTDPSGGQPALAAWWLIELWLNGVDVDWSRLHEGRRSRRVSLPTYPFQRQRYWIDLPGTTAPSAAGPQSAPRSDRPVRGAADPVQQLVGLAVHPPQQWFWRPGWRSAPDLPAPAPADLAEPWLLFADDAGLARRVAARLRAAGGFALLVRRGSGFARTGARSYVLDPDDPGHYAELLLDCRGRGWVPRVVGHFWGLDADQPGLGHGAAERVLRNLADLVRAFDTDGVERRLRVVTSGVYRVSGGEPVVASRAAATGPVLVAPLEYPSLDTRLVDVGPMAGRAARDRLATLLLAEFADGPAGRRVALRGARRWVQDLQRLDRLPEPDPDTVLRPGGVYMITGGLGGIGLAMAHRLAEAAAARLVLVGRHGLPDPARWDALVADPACPPELARRIAAVRGLEAHGGEVLVTAADVADPRQAAEAVRAAVGRFGRLDGVIHAAGVAGIGLMALKDSAAIAEVLAPKVAGTEALLAALAEVPVDFVVLFSSIAALTGGGPGQVDYCSANAYLDAVAHAAPGGGPRVISLDWGEWQWNGWDLGLADFGEPAAQFLRTNRERIGIGFDEGWRCLLRALAMPEPQLVVSPQHLPTLIEVSSRLTVAYIASLGLVQDTAASGVRHPRPLLSTPFEPAPEGLAAQIAELWGAALGVEQIGVHDSFFELGGNSLLAVDLVARIRRVAGGRAISPHVLYEAPTIDGLVRYLRGPGNGTDAKSGPDGSYDLQMRRARGSWRRESLAAVNARRTG